MSNTPGECNSSTAPANPPTNTVGVSSESSNRDAAAEIRPKWALLEEGDFASYQLVRDCIDGFQLIALNHYFRGTTVADREERAEDIKEQALAAKEALGSDGCPAGSVPTADGRCKPVG